MEAVEEERSVVRSVRHKSTAAALMTIGCPLYDITPTDDGWCNIELEVPPDLKDQAAKIAGDGGDVMVEWGTYRENLRTLSKCIKEVGNGGHEDD